MGLFNRKKDINKDLFIITLNEIKDEYNIDNDLYNYILNYYDIDKSSFKDNYLYIKDEVLFYALYIKLKIECLNVKYDDISNILNKISLIYINDENSIFPSIYNLIINLINENYDYSDIYLTLLKFNLLFKNNNILSKFIDNLLLIKDKEYLNKFINIISLLREICLEEELVNMFNYIRKNIDKLDESLLINKIKINKHICISNDDIYIEGLSAAIDCMCDSYDELDDNIFDNNKYIEKQINKLKKRVNKGE